MNHENDSQAEEENKEQKIKESKENVKKEAKGFFISIKNFLYEVLDFREDTDYEGTVKDIIGDISFKGATAWILICSIFVASVGLNANSTAVVIGAMLISPLMGPILGVGMSIAINDIDTLRKSFINLALMIVLSLLTAFLFFWLFPLSEDTSELLGRTKPDIRDVLIAFFGGLALIIARTKRGTVASVIFGVAIATALMPPLCTAGYGLAKGNIPYFLGAMYLFTINTIFIALATFLVLKLLRFPMRKYANSKKRKRIARVASLLALVVMVPATWTFVQVLKESNFHRDVKLFLDKDIEMLEHADYLRKNAYIEYNKGKSPVISFNSYGIEEIPESVIALIRERMQQYASLKNASLYVNQSRPGKVNNLNYLKQMRMRDSLDLMSQSQKILTLEEHLKQLEKMQRNTLPLPTFSKEVKINYKDVKRLAFANVISTNFESVDTISELSVKWAESVPIDSISVRELQLRDWVNIRYELDSLVVKTME